jgi:HEAT repeat protein
MKRALAIAACCMLFAQLACGPSERTVGMQQIHAIPARDRVAGAQTLGRIGKSDDDELWIALERLTRDPSVQVRIAAAESLTRAPIADDRSPDERGALADDALSSELGDLDETVRIAAARVLGGRCNPRSTAYLHGAFSRSGPAVRAEVASSLGKCGVTLEQVLNHAEQARRLHALDKLGSVIPAWRAAGARELGTLGRPDDVAKIAPLLDDKDGAVAAAAAEGLALANAKAEIPALQKMTGDEVPLLSAAAIDGLARFGTEALLGATPQLLKQAEGTEDVAVLAASAVVAVCAPPVICAAALRAKVPAAGAMLARGCPMAPFSDALVSAVASTPLSAGDAARASVLLEAMGQAAPTPLGKPGAKALAKLCGSSTGQLQIRCAQVALQLHEVEVGPTMLAIASREFHALDAERTQRKSQAQEQAATARQVADAAQQVPTADQQKLSRLMTMVKAHQEKTGAKPKVEASERLKQLLASEPVEPGANPLFAIALRAALGLEAKGAKELAEQLKDDRDRAVRAAARGEALPAPVVAPAIAADCFPSPKDVAPRTDGGELTELEQRRAEAQTLLVRAPSRAAKPGCLAALLSSGPQAALPQGALESARASLWSDDGQERADACALLAQLHDNDSAAVRQSLAHDPERRVRDACTSR